MRCHQTEQQIKQKHFCYIHLPCLSVVSGSTCGIIFLSKQLEQFFWGYFVSNLCLLPQDSWQKEPVGQRFFRAERGLRGHVVWGCLKVSKSFVDQVEQTASKEPDWADTHQHSQSVLDDNSKFRFPLSSRLESPHKFILFAAKI